MASRSFTPLAGLPLVVCWGVLVMGSAVLAGLLELAGLPAGLLLGAMVAAILVEMWGAKLRVPRLPYFAAQAVIGCMVARVITPGIVGTFLKDWPLFLALVLSIVVASSGIGWVLGKLRVMPGTTAIWGLSPGAASAMMLMAEAYGADARLVAFMQYVRVVMVVIAATILARFVLHLQGGVGAGMMWLAPVHWVGFWETLALAVLGGTAGWLLRFPAGVMMVPMMVGTVLHDAGLMTIELPPLLLAACYAFLGWNIGMGFTREILLHALRTLPQVIFAILTLMLFCGGLGFILVKAVGIDPLTAYLATSPGGADSVAIIAASSHVDVSFVMSLQIVRFVTVLLVGPMISRFVAGTLGSPKAGANDPGGIAARVKEDEGELD